MTEDSQLYNLLVELLRQAIQDARKGDEKAIVFLSSDSLVVWLTAFGIDPEKFLDGMVRQIGDNE